MTADRDRTGQAEPVAPHRKELEPGPVIPARAEACGFGFIGEPHRYFEFVEGACFAAAEVVVCHGEDIRADVLLADGGQGRGVFCGRRCASLCDSCSLREDGGRQDHRDDDPQLLAEVAVHTLNLCKIVLIG